LDAKSKNIYQSTIKQSSHEVRKEIEGRAPDLAEQMRVLGIKGGDSELFANAVVGAQQSLKQTDEIVGKLASKNVDVQHLVGSLDAKIGSLQNAGADEEAQIMLEYRDKMLERFAKAGMTPTVKDLWGYVKSVYATLSDSAFRTNANNGARIESMRLMAGAIRSTLAEVAPELDAAIVEQQVWIRTLEAMENSLVSKYGKSAIGLSDMLMGGLAVSSGNIAGMTGANIALRLVKDAGVRRAVAIGMRNQAVKMGGQQAIYDTLYRLVLGNIGLLPSAVVTPVPDQP